MNLLLNQHRRNPWIELQTESLGPLHKFGLGTSCALYAKQVRRNRDEPVSDQYSWCGQYRMSGTHGVLGYNPKLESARKAIRDRQDEDGQMRKRPTLLG
jgi:hypothetical protein